MVKFISEVSYSEQTKRAVPRKTRTALNVILSNCTNSRTFCWQVYGDCILPDLPQNRKTRGKCEKISLFSRRTFIFGHAHADLPMGGLEKRRYGMRKILPWFFIRPSDLLHT